MTTNNFVIFLATLFVEWRWNLHQFVHCQVGNQSWENRLVRNCEMGNLRFVKKAVENYGTSAVLNAELRSAFHEKNGSCLMRASANGMERVVKYLIDTGVDVNQALNETDDNFAKGTVALHLTAEWPSIVKLLVDAGADVNIRASTIPWAYSWSTSGHTPITYYTTRARNDPRITSASIKILLAAGANPNEWLVPNDEFDPQPNHTLVTYCSDTRSSSCQIEHLQLLLDAGADTELSYLPEETSPLFVTIESFQDCHHSAKPIAQALLDAGANLTRVNAQGMTPLHLAASKSYRYCVIPLLLLRGADMERKDNYQRTPLRVAIEHDNEEVITVLVKFGASLNKSDESDFARDKYEDNMKENSTLAAIQKGRQLFSTQPVPDDDYVAASNGGQCNRCSECYQTSYLGLNRTLNVFDKFRCVECKPYAFQCPHGRSCFALKHFPQWQSECRESGKNSNGVSKPTTLIFLLDIILLTALL